MTYEEAGYSSGRNRTGLNTGMGRQADIIVIGGGSSGLNTARILSGRGMDVVVLEREKEIGKNSVCTGVVGKEAFDELEISRSAVCASIKDVRFISPFGTVLTYQHPDPFAYVVDRSCIDTALADDIRSNGARIELGVGVSEIFAGDGFAEVLAVDVNGEELRYRAEMIVVATGIEHGLTKKIGMGFSKKFINGIQAEIRSDEVKQTTLTMGNAVAPGAFGWAVPLNDGRLRIGLMTDRNPKFYFDSLVKSLLPQTNNNIKEENICFRPVAQGILSKTYGDRVVAVGEAAGQVKATTGGGIYFGMLCAGIASEVILKNWSGKNLSASYLAEYETLWKQKILKELMVGLYARKLASKLTDTQIEKLFFMAKTNGAFSFIKRHGHFDWHSDLILDLIKKVPFFKNFL